MGMRKPARRRSSSHAVFTIESYEQLLRHERAILERIAALPNGGNLFMAHPFRLLREIGVEISAKTHDQIVRMHPELAALSEAPFDALRASGTEQPIQYRLKGLFKRRPS
jgi:hypothetical protein